MTWSAGPIYKHIVDALAHDIESGALPPGTSLPSQRELADSLGINFTTVTRAYDEARRKGLITAHAGQGTFVRVPLRGKSASQLSSRSITTLVDLGSNWPPRVPGMSDLPGLLIETLAERGSEAIEHRGGPLGPEHVAAGLSWVQPSFPFDVSGRVLVAAGARLAIFAAMSLLRGKESTVLTEGLGWPTIKALADLLGLKLVGLAMDEEGVRPDAFEHACRTTSARVLYCVPNLQNPTGATMGRKRRKDLVDVARRHGATIIEDDAYGRIPVELPPPIAAEAPDVSIYISGLSKCVSPGLRVAYVVARDSREAQRLGEILRLTMLTAPPLELLLATTAIERGVAQRIVDEIRVEMVERHRLLNQFLPSAIIKPGALHAWLHLPPSWPRAEFISEAARRWVRVAPSDAFTVPPYEAPDAVRISLGSASTEVDLSDALASLSQILDSSPNFASDVT